MTEESLSDQIKNLKFCVFDLETTGGNHQNDKVIEIGLVNIEGLEVVDTKHFLINPEIKIPDFIQKLTSISQDDVKDAPLIEEVVDEIVEFMGDNVLVAHNTSFDVPFFNSVLARLGKPQLENRSLCTNLMTRYLIPNLLNSNLNYMSKVFGIKHNKAHRALDDALAAAKLLLNYVNIFIHKDIKKINHLYYPRNKYELDRLHLRSKEEFEANKNNIRKIKTPFLLTIKGHNGVILYSFPSLSTEEQINFIMDKINSFDWESVTIRLFGSFLESFIQFNNLFNKMDIQMKKEVVSKLRGFHTKDYRLQGVSEETLSKKKVGDFVIAQHLVPEQFIIFPMKSLHAKSGLIFRYPGHKKKLLQYIQSRSSKGHSAKAKKAHYAPQLKDLIQNTIRYHFDKSDDFFIFDKDLALKTPEHFYKQFEIFSAKNKYHYNYPKEYI